MAVKSSDDLDAAAVFDFIDEYWNDLEHGREHPLAFYLARYPRHQESVAREYLGLKSPGPPSGGLAAPDSRAGGAIESAAARDDRDRIGPYILLRELGRGGQGAVFLAEDTRIARRVALKILASRFDMVSGERLRRFRREADVIARLEHPGICGIYDADIDGETPWIAMRFVEGETLAELLAAARRAAAPRKAQAPPARKLDPLTSSESAPRLSAARPELPSGISTTWPPRTPLDVHRALLLVERSARALHAAHEAGVVHRDVKPGNIIVMGDGTPVLLDFGLARDEQSEVTGLTESGDVFGTPAYMSPEQLSGSSAELDRRTDIYSLGVALYEALTLERPFEAPTRMALYESIQKAPMPDPRKRNPVLSEDVKVVLESALDKDRERRYPTALDLAEDLRRIREYEPVRARPAGVGLRFARWTRRNPTLAVTIIGTIVALSCGLVLSLVMLAREQAALARERVAVAEQGKALESALGRHLAERSVALITSDSGASLALAIDAVKRAPTYLTRSALFSALDACYLERILEVPDRSALRFTDIALSPDGSRVAGGADDGTTRVFELSTGALAATYAGPGHGTLLVRWSADGHYLAVASSAGELSVHDAASGDIVHAVRADRPFVQMEFDPEAARLLALSSSGHATIWNTTTWRPDAELDRGPGGIVRACFAPEGRHVLTIASPSHEKARTATLWDAQDGRTLFELGGDGAELSWCDTSRDARRPRALTASSDGRVRVFDLAGGAQTAELQLDAPIGFACFSPQASHVLVATDVSQEEGSAHLWNLATGDDLLLVGHSGRKVLHAAFDPDGSRVATASVDLSVRIWSTSDGHEERQYRTLFRPVSVHWSADGRRVVSCANALVAHVWSAVNHPDVITFKAHEKRVNSCVFSPDGRLALTASDDGSARVWFVGENPAEPASASRSGPETAKAQRAREPGGLVLALQHAGRVAAAWFSPDGEQILTVSADHTARLWSTRTGKPVRGALQHPGAVSSGSWSKDGTRVLTTCDDGLARLWRTQESEPTVLCTQSAARITCVCLDPAGTLVVAGADDDVLRLFDAATGDLVAALPFTRKGPRSGGIRDVAFHPRGDEVAAACGDNTVRFWSAATQRPCAADLSLFPPHSLCFSNDGARLLVIGHWGSGAVHVHDLVTNQFIRHPEIRHTDDITSGSFSRDGRYVLTASKDSTAYVWDAESGQPIVHRVGHPSPIACAVFSSDPGDPRVITGCEDGTVSIWPVDPLPAAERRKPRDLYDWEKAREMRLASPLKYE